MKKIRINELARELEVKPNIILDVLSELGVDEKKTHSSSIDEDVALRLRQRLFGENGGPSPSGYKAPRYDEAPAHDEHIEQAGRAEAASEKEPEASRPVPVREPSPVARPSVAPPEPVQASAAPPVEAPAPPRPSFRAQPLRPPLSVGSLPVPPGAAAPPPAPPLLRVPVAPALPVTPPATPAVAATTPTPAAPPAPVTSVPSTPVPAAPVQATPAAPPSPPAVPSAVAIPSSAIPSNVTPGNAMPGAPAPPPAPRQPLRPFSGPGQPPARPLAQPPRPGQILSGPRQPLPPSAADARPTGPGAPRAVPPPPSRPPAALPGAPMARAPLGPPPGRPQQPMRPPQQGMPIAPQGGNRPLAGQPTARPIVPPRPDLVARLTQNKNLPGAAPSSAPAVPRPGLPPRAPANPLPGQPIYRGPMRPGAPGRPGMPPGPGAPGMGGFQARRGPGGGMRHPTSPLRVEPATPPPTDTRRNQGKPGGHRPMDRRREMEREEGRVRQPMRRQEHIPPPPIDREITISEGITVKELSEKLGVKSNLLVKRLVEKKIFATINQALDSKLAEELARDFGASTNKVSYEEESTHEAVQQEETADLLPRAPVVTIMGHVDHGKTSLLDAIRVSNVADREAGGITQHIGAYRIEKAGRKIVFIDTPGHEAFTRMRARGAKVTDVVILVVAADDGVMPQTLEALDHARAAGVPIIVAITKVDKPGTNAERVKQQLADRGLLAEEYGGDVPMVAVSARTKENLDLLLEIILLVADLQELKANPARAAVGNVLEAQLDKGRGPVATVLVRNGTLKIGDFFICGSVFGKVRAMFDDRGKPVKEAEPSMPVEVLGLDALPEVGDVFQVITDTVKAKQIVIYRESKAREVAMAKNSRVTLEQLSAQMKTGEAKEMLVVLKADVGGTAEVLTDTLQKLSTDKVKVRVLSGGVGAITESDVLLASASNAIIIGFNVKPERNAIATSDKEKVEIRLHSIIYELVDEMKKAMTGLLEPVFKEVFTGRASVREVFKITKIGTIAGCLVQDGSIKRNSTARLLRNGAVVHTGKIESLKRFKDDASEVRSGFECGIGIANYNDVQPGDVIESFAMERVAVEAVV